MTLEIKTSWEIEEDTRNKIEEHCYEAKSEQDYFTEQVEQNIKSLFENKKWVSVESIKKLLDEQVTFYSSELKYKLIKELEGGQE